MGQFADYAEVNEYWPKERKGQSADLLDQFTSRKFHDMMDDRMLVSHFKYGDSRTGYPEKAEAWRNIELRVAKYLATGNAEFLVDAANFCMLEFMHPSHPTPFLQATDSDQSPGILNRDGQQTHGKHVDVDLTATTGRTTQEGK